MDVIGVVGAGAMGSGIAQAAAISGCSVRLFDAAPGVAEHAVNSICERLRSQVAKGSLDLDVDKVDLVGVTSLAEFASAQVVIEAVIEELAVKQQLFSDLEEIVDDSAVLASNTSSFSPTTLAVGLRAPHRVVGMHFFNPVHAMKLVEVVPGLATSDASVEVVSRLAVALGKTVVRSTATPGFIVNRVARPFYAEAWRLLADGAAYPATIDAVLTGAGGFRMGPFALMDLIGHDVNDAVTRSVWAAFGYDPRFAPSLAQRELVSAGWLGRKSGRGSYDYAVGASVSRAVPHRATEPPSGVVTHGSTGLEGLLERAGMPAVAGHAGTGFLELPGEILVTRCDGRSALEISAAAGAPVVVVDRALDDATATAIAISVSPQCPAHGVDQAVGLLQAAGLDVHLVDDAPGLIVTRTVAMLVNLATDALHQQVASADDIDTAMRLGANYPLGPLAWGDRWGAKSVLRILENLNNHDGDGHYRPSPLLRRAAVTARALS
jgi:3-hydroxybutyryl-CoA dehydrogenase